MDKNDTNMSNPYTVRSAADLFSLETQPAVDIWGGITLENGVNEIIGASGVGKSRIVLNLALVQALADTKRDAEGNPVVSYFGTLPVYNGPLTWLIMGTENSLHRLSSDIKAMLSTCTDEQRKVVGERVFLTTLEGEDDCDMSVGSPENVKRLKATIAAVKPDVLVFDPWGDICGGSELDDQVVRASVMQLRKLRQGVKTVMPVIIVNHARMGAFENARATGLDAANFGKNSKALYTISRCAWNIRFATDNPADGKLELINAKCSDGKNRQPMGIELDPKTMTYRTDSAYDPQLTQAGLVESFSGPVQNRASMKADKIALHIKKGVEAVVEAVKEGPISKADLDKALDIAGIPAREKTYVLSELQKNGFQSERAPGKNGVTYWGTTEQIEAFRKRKARDKKKSEKKKSKKKHD